MPVKKSCSVLSCNNNSNNSNATFFKPKNDIVAVRWRNLRPEEFSVDLPEFICSGHFFNNNIIVNNIVSRVYKELQEAVTGWKWGRQRREVQRYDRGGRQQDGGFIHAQR